MNLKNAAFLALVGTVMLAVLLELSAVSWGMFFVGSVLVGKKGAWPAPVAE